MKTINYNGMELPCIDSGHWPAGVTLVCNGGVEHKDVVCLCAGGVLTKRGYSYHEISWAILPPKPASRRLTNRETYGLWRKGWDYRSANGRVIEPCYMDVDKDDDVRHNSKLRAPNTDEWLEPTSDLLEVGE